VGLPAREVTLQRRTKTVLGGSQEWQKQEPEGGHAFTRHGQGEYVSKADRTIHTNTIEGYFSIFKRGMKGVYQHCGKQHLHRYLAEFDFRYNNRTALGVEDTQRSANAISGIVGKRLLYRDSLIN
jgi:hypothetical protein